MADVGIYKRFQAKAQAGNERAPDWQPLPKRLEENKMRRFKIIVEKHVDGYVAYPLGVKGVVIGQGDSYEEALADVKSALVFHIETFGVEVLDAEEMVLEAFVAEAGVAA